MYLCLVVKWFVIILNPVILLGFMYRNLVLFNKEYHLIFFDYITSNKATYDEILKYIFWTFRWCVQEIGDQI